jgi:hypothetical protein
MNTIGFAVLALAGLLSVGSTWAARTSGWYTYRYDAARDNAVRDGRTLASPLSSGIALLIISSPGTPVALEQPPTDRCQYGLHELR